MVLRDTLRRSLFALLPVAALTAACSGEIGDGNGSAEATPPVELVDPVNASTVEGSEQEDEGFASAVDYEHAPPGAPGSREDAVRSGEERGARGKALVSEARRQASFLNKSTSYYSHTTYMNEANGTRRTDCSGFLGYALKRVLPDAYQKVASDGSKVLAGEWHRYLAARDTAPSTESAPRFRRIAKATDLSPGDVVAWLIPPGVESDNTGHVMIVNGAPKAGRADKNEILVPVIDSTRAPHANDSRGTTMTGVGTGVIGLKVDADGQPVAYYWRGGESAVAYSTKIALGRVE